MGIKPSSHPSKSNPAKDAARTATRAGLESGAIEGVMRLLSSNKSSRSGWGLESQYVAGAARAHLVPLGVAEAGLAQGPQGFADEARALLGIKGHVRAEDHAFPSEESRAAFDGGARTKGGGGGVEAAEGVEGLFAERGLDGGGMLRGCAGAEQLKPRPEASGHHRHGPTGVVGDNDQAGMAVE